MVEPLSMEERQKALFEKARKGVLSLINDKGGTLSLGEMHDFCMNKYLIQHQSFSKLMETMVDAGLVVYNAESHEATISEAGKKLITP